MFRSFSFNSVRLFKINENFEEHNEINRYVRSKIILTCCGLWITVLEEFHDCFLFFNKYKLNYILITKAISNLIQTIGIEIE